MLAAITILICFLALLGRDAGISDPFADAVLIAVGGVLLGLLAMALSG